MSFAKKLGSKIFDDILGIDPSGQGLVGSIRDNPRTFGFMLGGIPGLLAGEGYKQYRKAEQQQGRETDPYAGFYNMPGMGGVTGGGVIGQSAFDYARSIAGGMPFEQIVEPGREFSLAQPMGEPIAERVIPPSPGLPVVPPPVFEPLPVEPVTPVIPEPIYTQPGGPLPIDLDRLRGFLGLFDNISAPEPQPAPVVPIVPEEPIYTQPGGVEPITPVKGLPELTPRSDQEIIDLIEGRLGEYQPVIPQPDLSGFARLEDIPSFVPRTDEEIRGLISEGIAGIPTPAQFDPSELQRQIGGLEEQIRAVPQFDPSRLQSRIRELENIPQFDPSGLLGRIGGLERQISEIPQPDLGGIRERIGALESREIPQFDPSGLLGRIGGLERQIGEIPQFDPSGLQSQIAELREKPMFDPSGLQAQISGLEQQISGLPQPQQIDVGALRQDILSQVPSFDPSGLQQQIVGLQEQLGGIPQFDPSGLQQQIEANRALLANLPQPQQIDIGALRQDILSQVPQFDPTDLLARISALESKPEPVYTQPGTDQPLLPVKSPLPKLSYFG